MQKWSKLEDKKPPVDIFFIVVVFDTFKYRSELRYLVIYRKLLYCDMYGFYIYDIEEDILLEEHSLVLA